MSERRPKNSPIACFNAGAKRVRSGVGSCRKTESAKCCPRLVPYGSDDRPAAAPYHLTRAKRLAASSAFSLELNAVLRCFLWVVWELVVGRDSWCELAGSLVSGVSEVDEVFKSPSHSFC